MVVLLLCVLELCLGVELCGGGCCRRGHRRARDAEARGADSDPPTPEPNQSPPSYDAIMAQGREGTHSGTTEGGREPGLRRGRGRESVPLKRDFSFHFKPPREDTLPPMRPPSSPGMSETSFVSPGELWLAVDGLPTYEEAVARLQDEEEEMKVQEGEVGAVNQEGEEAGVRQQEDTAERIQEDGNAGQQEEQVSVGLREEEAMATLQEGRVEIVAQEGEVGASQQEENTSERILEDQETGQREEGTPR